MDQNLGIHSETFLLHCRRLLAAGCHGVSVFGTTSEGVSFSVEERIFALEKLVEGGIHSRKLLPGTGSCALSDTVRLSCAALKMDTAGVLVLPPFYYKGVSEDGMYRFFAELIERIGDDQLRVYLYHIPQMSGVDLSLHLIGRLLEAYPGAIAGMKDSSGNLQYMRKICQEFPGFSVFTGTESFLLDNLRHGGAGCISATVNITSQLAREVYEAHAAGRKQETIALQERLTRIRSVVEDFPLIPALKHLMQQLTGQEQWLNLRPPLSSLAKEQAQELMGSLQNMCQT